jgi:uncharacterized membrane protein
MDLRDDQSREGAMALEEARIDRLTIFSDGVFAVLITVLAFELTPPRFPSFEAFVSLWPAGVSYAVSYAFIAVVWVNHHHLLRYASLATPGLVWGNFAHLFSVSLIPFSTAWIAKTQLAPIPVSFYAGVFVLVNATYIILYTEIVRSSRLEDVQPRERTIMWTRSLTTLAIFILAAIVALKYPIGGLVLICGCLALYVRPEAPKISSRI